MRLMDLLACFENVMSVMRILLGEGMNVNMKR